MNQDTGTCSVTWGDPEKTILYFILHPGPSEGPGDAETIRLWLILHPSKTKVSVDFLILSDFYLEFGLSYKGRWGEETGKDSKITVSYRRELLPTRLSTRHDPLETGKLSTRDSVCWSVRNSLFYWVEHLRFVSTSRHSLNFDDMMKEELVWRKVDGHRRSESIRLGGTLYPLPLPWSGKDPSDLFLSPGIKVQKTG